MYAGSANGAISEKSWPDVNEHLGLSLLERKVTPQYFRSRGSISEQIMIIFGSCVNLRMAMSRFEYVHARG